MINLVFTLAIVIPFFKTFLSINGFLNSNYFYKRGFLTVIELSLETLSFILGFLTLIILLLETLSLGLRVGDQYF